MREYCVVQGNIKRNPFYITSNVIEELGMDEKGEEIGLLLGLMICRGNDLENSST
jgi:hypothetical protein